MEPFSPWSLGMCSEFVMSENASRSSLVTTSIHYLAEYSRHYRFSPQIIHIQPSLSFYSVLDIKPRAFIFVDYFNPYDNFFT